MVRPAQPSEKTRRRVEAIVGTTEDWTARSGGFSSAGLWTVNGAGGDVFVKASTTDTTAEFLRYEMRVLGVVEAPFLPQVVGFDDDGERPILLLEDLSQAHWPPPWSSDQIDSCLDTLESISQTPPPKSLPSAADALALSESWAYISENHEAFQRLGVVQSGWFEDFSHILIDAASDHDSSGSQLIHCDIRSDNLCMADRVVVVDWNWAAIGNPMFDQVGWLPSLYLEGGPPPWMLLSGQPELVAAFAIFFLSNAMKPRHPEVRADIRQFQRDQGAVFLAWFSKELGLPSPGI